MNNCSAKTFYAVKADARRAKKGIRKRFHSSVKFYKCPHCEGWHLTTTRKKLNLEMATLQQQESFREVIQSGKAEFVRRISKQKTVWKVNLDRNAFIVTYNKLTKKSAINYYLGKGAK